MQFVRDINEFHSQPFWRSFVFCFLADVQAACFIHVVNMFYLCRQHQACLATITLVACSHAHVRHFVLFVLIETWQQSRGSPIHFTVTSRHEASVDNNRPNRSVIDALVHDTYPN